MKKIITQGILFLCSVMFLIASCRKIDRPENDEFNASVAKEWYYGVFKKSEAWMKSPLHGKKLPDWRYGQYRRVGNTEIVEFPLESIRKTVFLPGNIGAEPGLARIAESSLARIAFIKTGGNQILIRELTYIPEKEYLATSSFDVSDASLNNGSTFTGKVIVKDWTGLVLAIWNVKDGNVTGKSRMKFNAPKPNSAGSIIVQTENCVLVEVCEYEQNCTEWWQGDVFLGETCGPWMPTGLCWYEEFCDDDELPPCEGTPEECLCIVYSICDGGDGGNDEPCNLPSPDAVLGQGEPTATDIEGGVGPENVADSTRTWWKKWSFYTGRYPSKNLPLYVWRYFSFDQGTHKKVNGAWKWESITHVSESKEGSTPFIVNFTLNMAVPKITQDKLWAEMKLYYTVEVCVQCLDIPMGCSSKAESTIGDWNVNE